MMRGALAATAGVAAGGAALASPGRGMAATRTSSGVSASGARAVVAVTFDKDSFRTLGCEGRPRVPR